jgi:GNAT superfamily N-acetyltransferase
VTRPSIHIADDDTAIAGCYSVLSQLRPQLTEAEFVGRILQLRRNTGFQLAYLHDGGVRAVAGYRVGDWLHAGKYLEIEDLVTHQDSRSMGHGGQLFDWLVEEAARQNCRQIRLLSGVKRLDAHRFYQRKGMNIEASYFSMNIGGRQSS